MHLVDWISEAIDTLIFDAPNMPLCARAHWRKQRRFWRVWVRVFDFAFSRKEQGHCRACYDRRFPK